MSNNNQGGKKKEIDELEAAEKRFKRLLGRRNEINAEARETRDERDALNDEKGKVLEEMREVKEKRDVLNSEARMYKEQRNQHQAEAKKLIKHKRSLRSGAEGGARGRLRSLEAEVKALDLKQQTQPLTPDEEKDVIDKIKELQADLAQARKDAEEEQRLLVDVEDIDQRIDDLFKQADEAHEKVVALSKESDKVHEKLKPYYKELDHLSAESDKKHEAYIKLRERADHFHQRAMEMRERLEGIREERAEARERRRNLMREQNEKAQALSDDDALDEAADEAVKLLKEKGKVEF